MKKLMLVFIAVFVFSPLNAGIKLDYTKFSIDNADLNVRFYTDSIFGARGDALREGGTVSTLDFNQSFTSYNPAALAFQKTAVMAFSGIPFEVVSSDVVGFLMFGHSFSDDFANAITSTVSSAMNPVKATIGSSKLYIAQANGITGMEGMLPFADNKATIGVAREEKFGLDMSVLGGGISAAMDINDPSNPAFDMKLAANAGLAANLNIKSIVTSIGIGRKINDQLGVGVVLEYIDTMISVGASGSGQATVTDNTTGSPTFGDSLEYGSNEANSLDQSLAGQLEASAWALRVGTAYHAPGDLAELAVDFSIQPKFTFAGEIDSKIHLLPSSSDLLSQYQAGATSTSSTASVYTGNEFSMKLPSFFRATAAWKPGPVIALNYTHYFDDLSLSFDNSDLTGNVYLATTDVLRIGLNFEYFQIGVGMAVGRMGSLMIMKDGSSAPAVSNKSLPYPIGSMGFVVPVGKNIKTEWEVLAFPLPILKASLMAYY